MRSLGLDPGFEEWRQENQAEVYWATSRYSVLIQLVDVLSGLRGLVDARRVDPTVSLSQLKVEWLAIGKELDSAMLFDEIVSLRSDGIAEGPKRFAR